MSQFAPDGSRFETGPASAPVSIDDKRLPGGNLPLSVLGEMPAGAPGPDSAGLPGPVPSDRLGVGKGAGAYDPSAYDPSNDIMPHEADIDEITPAGKGTDKKPEKAADKPSEGVPTTPKRDAKLNNPPEKPVRGIGGGKPDGDNGAGKPDGDKGADGDLW